MKRYILFTEEELIEMIRGGEIAHKISGIDETLYFMCKDYFIDDDDDNDETNEVPARFIFKTEDAASFAIKSLKHKCDWYGFATLADWFDICGCANMNYLMNKEGWLKKHLENIKIEEVENGYEIKLPGTMYID